MNLTEPTASVRKLARLVFSAAWCLARNSSRRSATVLQPLAKPVALGKRQAERHDRRKSEDRGRQRRQERRVEQKIHEVGAHGCPQCLKLIILRITKMPTLIQTTQPASIRLPVRSVNSSLM